MKRFAGAICVDQGAPVLFSDFQDGGPMWMGTGPREVRLSQAFKAPFIGDPVVTIGLSMWDIDHLTNSRIDILAENVTPHGFDIVFRTWGDTRIARVRANWLAIGPGWEEDDW